MKLSEISEVVDVTERAVQRIVSDLVVAGFVSIEKVGRQNHYRVKADIPLRHPLEQHRTLAAHDQYASSGGWITGREAQAITYHKEYGEVGRVVVTPEMIS